ncbi:MAG: hypothetical protein AAGK02_17300, partial [Pseudomonadota bacterium]
MILAAELRSLGRLTDIPAWLVAIVLGTPVAAAVLGGLAFGGGETWDFVVETKLLSYVVTSHAAGTAVSSINMPVKVSRTS